MSGMKFVKSLSLRTLTAVFLATSLFAQEPPSKVDVFTGYQFLHPGDSSAATIIGAQDNIRRGFTVNGTYFLNRNWGLSIDGGWSACRCEPKVWTVQAGPTYRWPHERWTPFVHGFAGLHRMHMGTFGWDNNFGAIAGGGVDVVLFRGVSLRVIQADYEYARHDFGGLGSENFHGFRLAAGLVWRFGSIGEPTPVSAACSISPSEVYAGEPVTATASGSNFNPKRTLHYTWTATGVKYPVLKPRHRWIRPVCNLARIG